MDVQLVSDLHLEAPKAYDVFEIVPKSPILALAGDIGNVEAHKDDFAAFIDRLLRQFRVVLFVAGNHEAYHSTWPRTLDVLQKLEADVHKRRVDDDTLGEFVFLDRRAYRLADSSPGTSSGTVILGCSLFSHIPPARAMTVSMGMNDFYHIGDGWDVALHNAAHTRDLVWLNETVAALEGDEGVHTILVLTHWCPTLDARARDPKHTSDALTSAFATDLTAEPCFLSAKVKTWGFGHTHYNCDFEMERAGQRGPLRLVTNQRGYYFAQAAGFDDGKVLQINN
ncbi:Ser/Thr protein phosphatase superfamily [Sporothrix brasiliensis 5110]|uniref:Ser/Thr protein phosphatase superfamily n=1 Tax=Sporothrix brasiliensis 5110 TaxID=1398154 RepID=A0A0C2FRE6_9PEZI|nr:Ser/Thr protein phosphatase superfamily [Sporothrix brasiliensis 5110]KIH93588.1 Ser/Thr protein phosphatase superfamily [Sporothrix brasiliensis 5110]